MFVAATATEFILEVDLFSTFVSTSVTAKSNDLLDGAGGTTIHGVTKHIIISVDFLGEKYLQGWGDFVGSGRSESMTNREICLASRCDRGRMESSLGEFQPLFFDLCVLCFGPNDQIIEI